MGSKKVHVSFVLVACKFAALMKGEGSEIIELMEFYRSILGG